MARTILVVDDENNMRWVLEKALKKAGYEVITASRGDEGLRQFARHSVDLILVDLKMPGMDGFAVLERMEFLPASAMSGLTVFMLSATLDREDLERAEGHPIVEALLPKPLDVHQLRGWTDQIPLKGI